MPFGFYNIVANCISLIESALLFLGWNLQGTELYVVDKSVACLKMLWLASHKKRERSDGF